MDVEIGIHSKLTLSNYDRHTELPYPLHPPQLSPAHLSLPLSSLSRVRVLVLGDSGVGKSCLCQRLCGQDIDDIKRNETWTIGCQTHVKVSVHTSNGAVPVCAATRG